MLDGPAAFELSDRELQEAYPLTEASPFAGPDLDAWLRRVPGGVHCLRTHVDEAAAAVACAHQWFGELQEDLAEMGSEEAALKRGKPAGGPGRGSLTIAPVLISLAPAKHHAAVNDLDVNSAAGMARPAATYQLRR